MKQKKERGLWKLYASDPENPMRGMASPAGKPSPKTRRMYEFDYPLNPL